MSCAPVKVKRPWNELLLVLTRSTEFLGCFRETWATRTFECARCDKRFLVQRDSEIDREACEAALQHIREHP